MTIQQISTETTLEVAIGMLALSMLIELKRIPSTEYSRAAVLFQAMQSRVFGTDDVSAEDMLLFLEKKFLAQQI